MGDDVGSLVLNHRSFHNPVAPNAGITRRAAPMILYDNLRVRVRVHAVVRRRGFIQQVQHAFFK